MPPWALWKMQPDISVTGQWTAVLSKSPVTALETIKAGRIISRLCILVLIDAAVLWLNCCRCAHQFPSSVCVPWRGWMKTPSSSRTWCSSSPRTTTGSCTSSTSSARWPLQSSRYVISDVAHCGSAGVEMNEILTVSRVSVWLERERA